MIIYEEIAESVKDKVLYDLWLQKKKKYGYVSEIINHM